jgi:DNA polymerase-4
MSYYAARQLCPQLVYVKADMEKYLAETKQIRAVYANYTDTVIPYGMDEAWLKLPDSSWKEGEQVAELIRLEVKYALGLSVSVGVSFNYIFSKLGSECNKPGGITVIRKEDYKELLWPLAADRLLFVGPCRKKQLLAMGIRTIGDLAGAEPAILAKRLGKAGADLWRYANGDDRSFKPNSDSIQSLANTITPPRDLRNNDEACAVLYMLAHTVSARLKKHGLKTSCVSISLKDSRFNKIIRQRKLNQPSDQVNVLFNQAWDLFRANYRWEQPLRAAGVRADSLAEDCQLSFLEQEIPPVKGDVSEKVRALTRKMGLLKVERSAMGRDWDW